MELDKGKARKAFSQDKSIDRTADSLLLSGDNAMQGVANAMRYRANKRLIPKKTKDAYKAGAAYADKQAQSLRDAESLKAQGRGK